MLRRLIRRLRAGDERRNRSIENRSIEEERPLSDQRGDPAAVTEKAPFSYIIVSYDGENYRPLIVGALGHRLHFDGAALMLLCGVQRPAFGQRQMEVPVRTVPAEDLRKLRALLSAISTEVEA